MPGLGYRSTWSLAIEISCHLVQPFIYSTLTSPVSAPSTTTVSVASLGIPQNALYDGAQIIIDWNTPSQEIVTVTAVNESASSFTAAFGFAHAIGASVIGATFPKQAASGDYFFSQSEILSYIARAQNQFLADCPCVYFLNSQLVQIGQVYQQLLCEAIEINHASSSSMWVALASLTRASNEVTAVSQSPHGMVKGQKFSIYNPPDPTYAGAFVVDADPPNTTTFTYAQVGADGSTNGGAAVLWKRLYLTSQEEIYAQSPNWRAQNITEIRSLFEDRTGNYKFGVDGRPSTNLPVEMLVSLRDSDQLLMTDGFLVPDVTLHVQKWLAMSYIWSKNGEASNPLLAKYSEMRYRRGVATVNRWLKGMGLGLGNEEMEGAQVG